MHMDVDTAVSVFHLESSAGKGEIFPPCPWMCPLSPCTRGSSTGCPGLQRETLGVSLGRITGCLAQSLSIKFPGEASACVQPRGTLGSWAWQWRESLCVVVTSSLDHTSWETPPSLMLLEVLSGVSAHQQQHYVLATSCLPELAQDLAFAGVTSSKNVAAALAGGAAAPEKGGTNRLGQMARQVVFIPARQMQTGKPRLCIFPHV